MFIDLGAAGREKETSMGCLPFVPQLENEPTT